jgi:hypothetical protein
MVMTEQRLHRIIDAADRDDGEDVAIRKLLVTALRNRSLEMVWMINDRSPLLLRSCVPNGGRGAASQLRRAKPRNRSRISRRNRRR